MYFNITSLIKLPSYIICICAIFVTFATNAFAATEAPAPRLLIETTISAAKQLIADKKSSLARHEIEKEIKKIVYPAFDFREMARRSLGEHWKKGNSEQQKEFVDLFSELLGENYLDTVIDDIENCAIDFYGDRIEGNRAIVRTSIKSEDEIKVDYRLMNRNGSWLVYDVIIENIGLISNYRNEFAGIIRKETFDGLINQIRSKVEKRREEKFKN